MILENPGNRGLQSGNSDKMGEINPGFPGRTPGFLNFLVGFLDNLP